MGLIPGSGRLPGEGNSNPLEYSCLGKSMDRGACQATVHGLERVRHGLETKLSSGFITAIKCQRGFHCGFNLPQTPRLHWYHNVYTQYFECTIPIFILSFLCFNYSPWGNPRLPDHHLLLHSKLQSSAQPLDSIYWLFNSSIDGYWLFTDFYFYYY